ncbi:MAG TPA: sigma-70 family RNA polymerase sigma factor [Bryobacteraceae bacterium]|nr:sigma-70 family RNA polymerase sigma factor [Bryobacteraceae bacterium]
MEQKKSDRFAETVLPHLDAAYNLARWLTRNQHDAEDVVQEAYLRALRFFDGFRGGDGRGWLLAIVRNTCYTWLERDRGRAHTELDEDTPCAECGPTNPEALLLEKLNAASVSACIEELPVEFREVIVMRELEELSYKEVAAAAGVPIGTVMSRLARARKRLEDCLTARLKGGRE